MNSGLPGWCCRSHKKCGLDPWVGKNSQSRKWKPTPGFLPGKPQEQRSLAGHSSRGRKESDTTQVAEHSTAHINAAAKIPQSRPPLFDPMDYCSVRGILQAGSLGWVAIPFSRGSSRPRNRTSVSCTAGGFFTSWAIREAPINQNSGSYFQRNNPFLIWCDSTEHLEQRFINCW